MSLPKKSTDSRKTPERHWGEDLARLHCLQVLFPDWTGNDRFLLNQLKDSIEASIRQQSQLPDTFEVFSLMASCLRDGDSTFVPASHVFIQLDYSEKTWDPLFSRQEIIAELKKSSGIDHIFLLIRGLRQALFPSARYRTRGRDTAFAEATRFIDELAIRWSTDSSKVHLLYL